MTDLNNFIDDMLLLNNNIDCTEYNNCPKEKKYYNSFYENTDTFSFLFLGPLGFYCKDDKYLSKYKKKEYKLENYRQDKQEEVENSVVESIIKFTDINGKVNAVILAGDNIYSDTNISDNDIDEKLDIGFLKCMKNVDTDIFLLGIGNNDIKNCYILNKQINFKSWFLPSLSYNMLYKLNDFFINFIFIDTNIYEKMWCNNKNYPENAQEQQDKWLTSILNKYNNPNTWNIVIGHIPFLANSHKKDNIRYEKLLYDLISNNSYLIDLYMCTDENHNQQYINTTPPQIISGSGGVLDKDIYIVDSKFNIKNKTFFNNIGYGFVYVSIKKDIINLTYHSSTNSYSPKTFTINKKR
jgi:hypothetical protein